jgi:hypothetical protein
MEEGRLENESATLKKASTYITGDMEAPQTVSEASPAAEVAAGAEGAPAGSLADPGPDLDERIVAAFADGAKSAFVSRLLPEIEAAAAAADVAAAEARSKALDPMLPRAEVVAVRRQSDDAAFERDRLLEAAKKLATRLAELKASEHSAVLTAQHDELASERERLAAELVGMTGTLAQIGRLALAIDACEREVKRWNPLGGRTHGYIRPVLSADLPPTLAGLFADARVMDSFIGMAMSPPLPSSPSAKLRAV